MQKHFDKNENFEKKKIAKNTRNLFKQMQSFYEKIAKIHQKE